jgi:L-alanine-DL-glutamate epimerase-like enolase superfamily enzyme
MPDEGRIQLPDRPGLGLEFDEGALAKAIVD